jgi:signal transduction histidine kinase
MKDGNLVITLQTIRQHLGERAANKLSAALRPPLDLETAEGARRYVTGVPGDRIRRLRDRAAFAAAMAHLVRTDLSARRWALRLLSQSTNKDGASREPRGSLNTRPRRRAVRRPRKAA